MSASVMGQDLDMTMAGCVFLVPVVVEGGLELGGVVKCDDEKGGFFLNSHMHVFECYPLLS